MLKHRRAGRFFGTRLEVLEDKLKNTAKKNISILHKKNRPCWEYRWKLWKRLGWFRINGFTCRVTKISIGSSEQKLNVQFPLGILGTKTEALRLLWPETVYSRTLHPVWIIKKSRFKNMINLFPGDFAPVVICAGVLTVLSMGRNMPLKLWIPLLLSLVVLKSLNTATFLERPRIL